MVRVSTELKVGENSILRY